MWACVPSQPGPFRPRTVSIMQTGPHWLDETSCLDGVNPKKRAAALHKLNPLSASDLDVQPVEWLLRFVQLCRHWHTTAVMGISMWVHTHAPARAHAHTPAHTQSPRWRKAHTTPRLVDGSIDFWRPRSFFPFSLIINSQKQKRTCTALLNLNCSLKYHLWVRWTLQWVNTWLWYGQAGLVSHQMFFDMHNRERRKCKMWARADITETLLMLQRFCQQKKNPLKIFLLLHYCKIVA